MASTVQVFLLSGRCLSVTVASAGATPLTIEVKRSIQSAHGIPIAEQVLSAQGRVLTNMEPVSPQVSLVLGMSVDSYAKAFMQENSKLARRRMWPSTLLKPPAPLSAEQLLAHAQEAFGRYACFVSCTWVRPSATGRARSPSTRVSPACIDEYLGRLVCDAVATEAAERRAREVSDVTDVDSRRDYVTRAWSGEESCSVEAACLESARRDALVLDPEEAEMLRTWPGSLLAQQ
uniref:Ubiquitin-like domain-containing protein n=1 Tax=Alexandrium monilatum TaxID=311494 RepID=A0A7S4VCQ0_9DINO|mmetsp:Transcript_87187/g.275330  ORF Transcript_87187/g.275330 Transcript_87187/m.275330 type:complete len:233 (+) Transcript_87187:113-811(+)